MSRYIDADRLKDNKEMRKVFSNPTDELYGMLQLIDEQPTADVVEVVYCRDCIHRADIEEANCGVCEIVHRYRKGNDYCICGERREK